MTPCVDFRTQKVRLETDDGFQTVRFTGECGHSWDESADGMRFAYEHEDDMSVFRICPKCLAIEMERPEL